MKKMVFAVAASVLLATPLLAQPQYSGGNRPVMLQAKGDVDACSFGKISDPEPDGAVIVFPGDSTDLDAVDYVSDGRQVWICDETEDGDMLGIVYATDPDTDCEVSSPVDEDRDYVGPCSWGWVKSEWVELQAG